MKQVRSAQAAHNNVLYAAFGCMKVSENPFVNQLHEMLQNHPGAQFVNVGMLFGSLYKRERNPRKEKAIGLTPTSTAKARTAATEYLLDILDLVHYSVGGPTLPPREMLPTLADLGPKSRSMKEDA